MRFPPRYTPTTPIRSPPCYPANMTDIHTTIFPDLTEPRFPIHPVLSFPTKEVSMTE